MEQCAFTREQIEAMQNVDIRTVDPETLRDIRDVTVNASPSNRQSLLLPPWKICGEGQLHRYRRELGGQDALLHTFKMLTEKFFAKHSGHLPEVMLT